MRLKPYPTAKYAFPILFAAIAVALFAAPANRAIVPGAVEFSNGKITGSFKVITTGGPDSLLSNGTGGACLFADLNRFNIPSRPTDRTCTDDSQCQAGLPLLGLAVSEWAGHCDKEGDHKCWVRPGPDDHELCNKQPFIPWPDNKEQKSNPDTFDLSKRRYEVSGPGPGAAAFESFARKFPGRVRWRVVACLNGVFTPQSGVFPPCATPGSTNRRLEFGEPKWIPGPP
jgi:hypothetical protein